MNSRPEFGELKENQNTLRFQFILTELDLAVTFLGIAQTTNNDERSERNMKHAEEAVLVAKKFLRHAELTNNMRAEIFERVQKLEPLLIRVNESAAATRRSIGRHGS